MDGTIRPEKELKLKKLQARCRKKDEGAWTKKFESIGVRRRSCMGRERF